MSSGKPLLCGIRKHISAGYTLTEILITLGILGIALAIAVATLNIKQEKVQSKTIFKESIKILYDVMKEGMTTDELQATNGATYFLGKINAVVVCPSDSKDEGCWDVSKQRGANHPGPVNQAVTGFNYDDTQQAGVILHNGVNIIGLNNGIAPAGNPGELFNSVLIDWNNVGEPNETGKDQLWVRLCYGTIDCTTSFNQKLGTIAPMSNWDDYYSGGGECAERRQAKRNIEHFYEIYDRIEVAPLGGGCSP